MGNFVACDGSASGHATVAFHTWLRTVNQIRGYSGTAHYESDTASGARDAEAGALDGATAQHTGKEGGIALPFLCNSSEHFSSAMLHFEVYLILFQAYPLVLNSTGLCLTRCCKKEHETQHKITLKMASLHQNRRNILKDVSLSFILLLAVLGKKNLWSAEENALLSYWFYL